MSVIELIDNYESGRGQIRGYQKTVKRVLLVTPFNGWESDPGVPHFGDEHPDDSNLKVTQIEFEGCGGIDETSAALLKYKSAKVTVTYSSNQNADITLARYEMAGELLEVGGFGTFESSGNPVERPLNIPIAIGSLVIPRQIYPIPLSTIFTLLNKVNNAGWAYDGFTHPAETVYFAGFNAELKWFGDVGQALWDIQYYFKINPQGWNVAWDGAAGTWDTVLPKRFTSASFVGFPP